MREFPYVSVIVPVYNGQKTIDMCLKALTNLNWQKQKLEIIVVDNKSTDRTCDFIQRYSNVRLIHENKILSSYGARNRGIQTAKGEIIAFTDADCKPSDQWLQELLKESNDENIGCFVGEVKPLPPRNIIEKFFNEDFWSNKPNNNGLPKVKTANCAYKKANNWRRF
jgi:glycosyltransferase involved in cell wall biosynthesis